jgi:hypothetical protein
MDVLGGLGIEIKLGNRNHKQSALYVTIRNLPGFDPSASITLYIDNKEKPKIGALGDDDGDDDDSGSPGTPG